MSFLSLSLLFCGSFFPYTLFLFFFTTSLPLSFFLKFYPFFSYLFFFPLFLHLPFHSPLKCFLFSFYLSFLFFLFLSSFFFLFSLYILTSLCLLLPFIYSFIFSFFLSFFRSSFFYYFSCFFFFFFTSFHSYFHSSFFLSFFLSFYQTRLDGWGCRIYRLHLCSRVRHSSPTIVLEMTLNHLMVRLQYWRFGEWGVSHHYPYSQVYSDPE